MRVLNTVARFSKFFKVRGENVPDVLNVVIIYVIIYVAMISLSIVVARLPVFTCGYGVSMIASGARC